MKQLKATRRVLIGAGAAVAVGAAAFGASAFFKDRKPSEFNARLIVGSDTDNSIAVQLHGEGKNLSPADSTDSGTASVNDV